MGNQSPKKKEDLRELIVSMLSSKNRISRMYQQIQMRASTIGLKIHLQVMKHSQRQIRRPHQVMHLET